MRKTWPRGGEREGSPAGGGNIRGKEGLMLSLPLAVATVRYRPSTTYSCMSSGISRPISSATVPLTT